MIDCLNENVFAVYGRWTASEFAATTSAGSVYSRLCGTVATAKARLPTVDSLTGGTTRQLALVERSVRRPQASRRHGSADLGNAVHRPGRGRNYSTLYVCTSAVVDGTMFSHLTIKAPRCNALG